MQTACLQRLRDPRELMGRGRAECLAIGMFDGVHLGHQHVIRQAVIDARRAGGQAVVLTFDPHPMTVVRPDRVPQLLQTLEQRLAAIAQCGADAAWVIRFDEHRSRQSGLEFVQELESSFPRLSSISVGQGFSFGHGRSGDVGLLLAEGARVGFRVHALSPISIGGETVSSTRIRQTLREGDLDHVAELLGRPYAASGLVMKGKQLARTWGVPTANVDVRGLELPPPGVYLAQVVVLGGGGRYPAVLNLGKRPTLDGGGSVHLEVHLFGFSGDLYGNEIEVEFEERLREERKFPDVDALRRQVLEDVAAARRHWGCQAPEK